LINQELVEKGLASWVDYLPSLGPGSETEIYEDMGQQSTEETGIEDTGRVAEAEGMPIV